MEPPSIGWFKSRRSIWKMCTQNKKKQFSPEHLTSKLLLLARLAIFKQSSNSIQIIKVKPGFDYDPNWKISKAHFKFRSHLASQITFQVSRQKNCKNQSHTWIAEIRLHCNVVDDLVLYLKIESADVVKQDWKSFQSLPASIILVYCIGSNMG
jgi:hypothetical protein